MTNFLKKPNLKNIAFGGSIIALVAFSYLWRLKMLNTFSFNYDEGIHLILAKLWALGYIPYSEIFVSYPPIFIWSLGIPQKLFQHTTALQLVMSTYAILGVLGVIYLGSVYGSRLSGIVAGILLSFVPAYFKASIAVMGEAPSIGVAVVSIALAEEHRRSGGWQWLVLSGGAAAFALSLKLLPVYVIPMVGLIVISKHLSIDSLRISSRLLRDIAILAAGFLFVFIIPFLFFDIQALLDQVITMRLTSRETQFRTFSSNNADMINFLFSYAGITILSIYALTFVVIPKLTRYWLLVVWFGLVWISMLFHVPLRGKHLPVLLPPLTIFAGLAIDHIFNYLKQLKGQTFSLRMLSMLTAIIFIISLCLWRIPTVIAQNNGWDYTANENIERSKAVEFINQIAFPEDCVIADNPVFLYNTNRLPPPQLAETSQTRIDTGHLTSADVIQTIEMYQCHVVAVVSPRFGKSMPGLSDWLSENYFGVYAQRDTFVYFAKKGGDDLYAPLKDNYFDNGLLLYGINIEDQPQSKRQRFVSLYWELNTPIRDEFVDRIALYNADKQKVYQVDRLPFQGLADTAHWQVGERVRDTFRLDLPVDLPPGDYDLYLSICSQQTGECSRSALVQSETELYIGQIILNGDYDRN